MSNNAVQVAAGMWHSVAIVACSYTNDSDADGLSDGVEANIYKTDPFKADTDGDGLSDRAEGSRFDLISGGSWTWTQAKTDAVARGGRLAIFPTYESWQRFFATLPSSTPQGWIGLTDEAVEGQWRWVDGSSLGYSTAWDTGEPNNFSGDEDYAQWAAGSGKWRDHNSTIAFSVYAIQYTASADALGTDPTKADTDGDGLNDGAEVNVYKTDPLKTDTDGDGLSDGAEVNTHKTDPLKTDTDGDTLSDGAEINTYKSDPLKADTDGDGLSDGVEANIYKTDPLKADTDGDGLSDRAEGSRFDLISGGSWTWTQAKTDAVARGGRLAVFPTYESWQRFFATLPSSTPQGWIGLTDEAVEGQWRWVDGSSLGYSTAWDTGEPNSFGGNEDYVQWAAGSGKWRDHNSTIAFSVYAIQYTFSADALGTDPTKADTDGDGLNDGAEINVYKTDPLKGDTEGDGLSDGAEVNTYKTDPLKSDTDGDGLSDGAEVNTQKTDPLKVDTDSDGLSDGAEVNTYKTSPLKTDTDGDGLSDSDEINTYKTDPLKADTDGDGLSDGAEINTQKTNPLNSDTDGDGLSDGAEVNTQKTDPLKVDTDSDGLSDGAEVNTYKTSPLKSDTDGDGLSDSDEINTYKTDPLKTDTDGDGLSDPSEIGTYKTDPLKADTDGDGLGDGLEVSTYKTDPLKADTDGDGLSDSTELLLRYPANSASFQLVTGGSWTWAQAQTDAVARGGRLAVFPTLASWQAFFASLPAGTASGWIGLTDEAVEGQWRWVDGAALNYSSWASGQPGSPVDISANSDYCRWQTDGLWDDVNSQAVLACYILEIPVGSPRPLSPTNADCDGDGLIDGAEVNTYKTNPLIADTDSDGLSDGLEVNTYKTDPLKTDTDADGFSDSFEVLNLKSNPIGPNNEPSFTTVTNPRNPDEDNAGYDVENAGIGYVGQEYEIAITEVTNLMYARFLNAIAKTDSLYGLYTTLMGSDAKGGIVRSGSSGNYTYAVKSGFENKPVNFVSLFDTLRYINWLHNGMPTTQVQDETTTENGAYKLLGSNPRQVVRNFTAKYFLPDQDEWHKAAFFDPAPGGGRPSDSYWPYADQTTTGPGGNFGTDRTAVVSTSAGASHYGTYDQGGNVWEWTETVLPDERRLISQGNRPMSPALVTQETADLGFRVGKPVLRSQVSPLVIPAIVPVGEAYNLGDDMANNRGGVAYDFQMGTYEVTNEEYAAFLNAVAKTDGFYGLYNTQMGSNAQGGITRSGSNGSFVYTVKPGFAKKPVNFVTAYNAMRFCNWLHNGAQPDGDTESGAYRLLGNIPSNTTVLRRNAGARYYLPTEDEWYKAAFYDSSIAAMLTGNYWAYAVKSDTASGSTINFGGAFGGLSDVTTPGYPSYFGTYGQSGNAAEWTETLSGSYRVVRGGHYASAAASVSYTGFITLDPSTVAANVGFRIAAARAIQNIAAFAPIAAKTFGDAPFSITLPAASSGLPVAVSVKSGPATISGNTVTITGAGTVVLAANQSGDWYYDAATETTVSFTVAKRSQTIGAFTAVPTKTFGSAPFGITAPAASSGLPVTLSVKSGPATISSNVVTLTNVGTVFLAANQAGNDNYSAASEVTTSFSVVSFDSEFQTWLGRYPSMNAQKKGVSDDADGDGMPNLAEFAMDRDPSSAPSTERITPVLSGNQLRLIFNRRKDCAALGLQIFAETSSSLDAAGWTKTGVVEQVISNNVTTETIQAAVPTQSAAKKFLRVRVVK